MFNSNLKLAFQSLRSTKARTFFTMLGVIIGVVSVVVTVSIGVGIRRQITTQIDQFGSDLITVLPGQTPDNSTNNLFERMSLLPTPGTGSFNERDLDLISSTKDVRVAVPLSVVTGSISQGGQQFSNFPVIATTQGLPTVLNQGVTYGAFFTPPTPGSNPYMAVIGQNVASQVFGLQSPIGHSFSFRGHSFIVAGIFNQFNTSPLSPISNYNSTIFIPFGIGSQLSGGQPQIYEIYAKPDNSSQTDQVASSIKQTLLNERGGQDNFSILEQKQDLAIANKTLDLITGLIAGVAGISLFVGGIGIMNIMLVSVIERTHEIGIRKAVGGANRQIMMQFLIESGSIGLMGGIIGVIVSEIIDIFISILTTLRPAITLPIALLAVGIGLLAGIIFGVMPAMRAAHKDPVKSLRHE